MSTVSDEFASQLLEEIDAAVVVADLTIARVLFANQNAMRILERLGGGPDALPGIVASAARDGIRQASEGTFARAACVQNADGPRYMVRAKRMSGSSLVLILLAPYVTRANDIDGVLRRFEGLSAGDRRVVALLHRGLRNKEIGEQLALGEGTVKQYLHRIYATIGVRGRVELIAEIERQLRGAARTGEER